MPEASKSEATQGESSRKNKSGGAMDIAALINNQMEEFRNMLLSSQQQIVSRLEETQTQSETRLAKIEAELSSFILAVAQLFGEVERRVVEEETSSQASVIELRKVEEYLQ